ncbi:hypothetical protein [Diplocloster modestus]|uniref:Uncharacterized protein n=1 Tax=Diplocloster modestus TaxID=2850322 RepID=A0ABS6K3F4_9FIRM|nr:hypothetical protein [Diplocloster modestus]MBU9725039.1 hypothetical protein [Diplocloster modestus]
MNSVETRKHSIDPRTGLFLLILANIIAFTQNSVWVEFGWNFTLVLLLLLCGCVRAGFKWLAGFGLLLGLQWFVLPVSPKIIATSFTIFINYGRQNLKYQEAAKGKLLCDAGCKPSVVL